MTTEQINTKTVTLTFQRSELLYDISNNAFVEADIMGEGNEHAQHQTFDIAEDGNVNRVTRMLNLAHAECVEILYPFSKTAVENTETRSDALTEATSYSIVLSVPETFSKSTVDLLEHYIHEYLICRVLADWFSITKPEAAANWRGKMEEAKQSILDAKSIRLKRIRRGMSPL